MTTNEEFEDIMEKIKKESEKGVTLYFPDHMDTKQWSEFSEALILSPSVTAVSFNQQHAITVMSNIKFLANALAHNQSITTLSFHNVNLGRREENLKPLADALTQSSIRMVNFRHNTIMGKVNFEFFRNAFSLNQSLTSLDLACNHLGGCLLRENKFKFFAEMLANHPSLTRLNLSANDLNNLKENLESLTEAFAQNRTLTSLALVDNYFGDSKFLAHVARSRSITELDLRCNYLEKNQTLITALSQNRVIQQLQINEIKDTDNQALQEVTKRNRLIIHNLRSIAILIAFTRANRDHPYRTSVLPFNTQDNRIIQFVNLNLNKQE